MTLSELVQAYKDGTITLPLMIDNDDVHVWDMREQEPMFEMHPSELLEQALDLLGIPHEPV